MKTITPIFSILLLLTIGFQTSLYSQENIIIKKDAQWKYYDKEILADDWYTSSQNNLHWKQGTTPIGYGDRKVVTKIYSGNNPKKKDVAKYFKKTFTIHSLNEYVAFELRIQRDDGAVIYCNNKEIYRDNMPTKIDITGNTLAVEMVARNDERTFYSKVISPKAFKEGQNIFHISVHQYDVSSSDCIFNLELIGYKSYKVLNNVLNNSAENINRQNIAIKDLKNQFEKEKVELELNIVKHSNGNLKFILFIVSLLLILSLIGYYLIINIQNKKERASNDVIYNLKKETINKEREMLTLSTKIVHNKQSLKELKTEIKGLKTNDTSVVKSILKQIDHSLEREDDWQHLKNHFDAVHNGFYNKLIDKHPLLTETELRHCMFIKLHLQTKEIARILLIDPRSVQTSRYRIKKKMGLSENEDLRLYLLNLTKH